MNVDQRHTPTMMRHRQPHHADPRFSVYGGWLVLVRVTWVVVLVLALALFIISIPIKYADAHTICFAVSCKGSDRPTLEIVHELQHQGLSLDFYVLSYLVMSFIFEGAYVATGVILFWHKSDDRMALITSLALITFGTAFQVSNLAAGTLPSAVHILSLWMAFLGNCCIGLFFYVFPTGRFALRWLRWLAVCWIAYWGFNNVFLVSFIASSGLNAVVFLGLIASVIPLQVYQYRRMSTPLERQQTKWVVFGLSLALGGFLMTLIVIPHFSHQIVGPLLSIFLLFIPLSLGMAIFRSHLYDIDIIIHRTLVYGTLTACVVALYVLVVVGLGVLLQTSGNLLISLMATSLIAVLFQPLRLRLQRAINRLMFGERDTPYTVISRLGQRLEATLAPEAVLPTIVESVAHALKLPYTAIALRQQGELVIAASYGISKEGLTRLPLIYQTEQIGELLLAARTPGESFTPADRRLLDDLARQTGVAVHAIRLTQELKHLTQDLQLARERLVSAREEERRRLRRDLHDGLGPQLSSQTLLLTSAQMLLRQDPDEVEAILGSAIKQSQQAISDIRRLVYALRPPALDDLGLVAAIQEQLTRNRASGIAFTFDAPQQLPLLPAAVEVACYRIVQEALTNVVRHAHAHTCMVRLVCREQVSIEIIDDGQGLPPAYRGGVGLTSMRERAEELGGSWLIGPGLYGGTRVQAQIPYR